jgi:hypothetical protein
MTYQSQTDINAFFCLVAQQVAGSSRVGLDDSEFKSTSEIMSEMRANHEDLLSLLKDFFCRYQSWHDLHVEIEASGDSGDLSSEQEAMLSAAVQARDSSRNKLLKSIAA